MYDTIPDDLKNWLRSEPNWEALTTATFANAGRYIVNDRPEFFPEYTDHGPRHVVQVIDIAWRLVAPNTKANRAFLAQDAAALAICTLLHDIAMHITQEGFHSLIATNSKWKPLHGWAETSWRDLWSQFLIEAKRWDDRKRADVFGPEPFTVRDPPLGTAQMADGDRLLIGEFLRRHHPRLAHEIAVYGFPGRDGATVPILHSDSTPQHKTLAEFLGLISRSHGLPLREAVDRLGHQKASFRGIHATYVMALLRLADFADLKHDRAPAKTLTLVRILSDQSQKEWAAHNAIDDVRLDDHQYPETLFVYASPPDVQTYAKVRSWLDGIQEEFDQCWAVLGEVYGRKPDQERLDLSVRRVKSNLDDEAFARQAEYVPERISFTTSGGRLLKLLVGPLYGNDPKYGIRELIQNAVDAVRERKLLCDKFKDLEPIPESEDGDVLVSIDLDEVTGKAVSVTVRDHGIGMTEAIIRDYFLKAGATYRNSADWQKTFTDADGNTKVLRTGRFGIGALAAFLIGNSIEVTTRHIEAERGLHFTTSLDEELINITRLGCDVDIGTKIVVRDLKGTRFFDNILSDHEYHINEWDFFCGKWPRVVRKIGSRTLRQKVFEPSGPEWWTFTASGFGTIFASWVISSHYKLIVNGVRVDTHELFMGGEIRRVIATPLLVADDPKGHFPINLDRSGLSDALSFERELARFGILDRLSRLLAWGFTDKHWSYDFTMWCGTRDGVLFNSPGLLRRFEIDTLIIQASPFRSGAACKKINAPKKSIKKGVAINIYGSLLDLGNVEEFILNDFYFGIASGGPIYVAANWPLHFVGNVKSVEENYSFQICRDEVTGEVLVKEGGPQKFKVDLIRLIQQQVQMATLVEMPIKMDGPVDEIIVSLWEEIVGPHPLPWGASERENQLEHLMADEQFAEKVAYYRAMPESEREPLVDFSWFS